MMSLVLLLFSHFLADFVLQDRKMAKRKSEDVGMLLYHLFIQFAVLFFCASFFASIRSAVLFSFLNALIHGPIDWNVWKLYKSYATKRAFDLRVYTDYPYWEDHAFYMTIGFDQFLHTITIVLLWGFYGHASGA